MDLISGLNDQPNLHGCSGNVVPQLPQVLPAKVAAAEFTLVLAAMPGAIIPPAVRIAVIDVRVKPFARGVAVLLVPHGAKRHATNAVFLLFARLLAAQNGVVFFATHMRALKSDELVVFRIFNDHVYTMHVHDFFFQRDG